MVIHSRLANRLRRMVRYGHLTPIPAPWLIQTESKTCSYTILQQYPSSSFTMMFSLARTLRRQSMIMQGYDMCLLLILSTTYASNSHGNPQSNRYGLLCDEMSDVESIYNSADHPSGDLVLPFIDEFLPVLDDGLEMPPS